MKKPNKVGGGAKTNLNGLEFEQTTDLQTLLENLPDFTISGNHVFKDMEKVAELCGNKAALQKHTRTAWGRFSAVDFKTT